MAKGQRKRPASTKRQSEYLGVGINETARNGDAQSGSVDFAAWEADFDRRLAAAHAQIDDVIRSLKK